MSRRALLRMVLPLLLLPVLVAACGGNSMSGMSGMNKKGSGSMNMSGLPSWASQLKVHILSPSNGTTITGNVVPLQLSFSGYTPSCLLAGTPVTKGTGHFHVLLDGNLVSMFCSSNVDISMQNVKPGAHKITIIPALNDHQTVDANEVSLHFTYKPSDALPTIKPASITSAPSIKIVAPAAGTAVSGTFDMTVQVSGFDLSCPMQGKGAVDGYGSWNLNLDTIHGAMDGMATMARISCTATIQMSTAGIKPGQHAFIAYLVNGAQQVLVPMASNQIDLTVK